MVRIENGGTQDLLDQAYQQFLDAAAEVQTPTVLLCPSDRLMKLASSWPEFSTNGNQSLSYFAGLCASESAPRTFLTGDRNLSNLAMFSGCTNSGGMIATPIQTATRWNSEMHNSRGNIAFADGSVEQMTILKLQQQSANPAADARCTTNHILAPCPTCQFGP
jgi:prepilin-type processing-associated H-X9-DG protein